LIRFDAWFAAATYPVTIDPTFGNEDVGLTETFNSDNSGDGAKASAPEDGTIDSMHIYGRHSGGGNIKAVLWNDDGSNTVVTDGVGGTAAPSNSSQWWTLTYSTPPSITNGSSYYLGIVTSTNFFHVVYDVGGDLDEEVYDGGNSYTTPEDLNGIDAARIVSFYATYTPTTPFISPRHQWNLRLARM
jgi:hypothetical protein